MSSREDIFRRRIRADALDRLRQKLLAAVAEYDRSGDHNHDGAPVPGDCVRCKVLVALGRSPFERGTLVVHNGR